jgi:hypothetical protein
MSQWIGPRKTGDGAFDIPALFSCADHLDYTRYKHPNNHVMLDGKRCLYCHAR